MKSLVVIVRHPDHANDVAIYEGDEVGVDYIDVDLGSQFDGTPEDHDQWEEWAAAIRPLDLPEDHPALAQIEALIAELEPTD